MGGYPPAHLSDESRRYGRPKRSIIKVGTPHTEPQIGILRIAALAVLTC